MVMRKYRRGVGRRFRRSAFRRRGIRRSNRIARPFRVRRAFRRRRAISRRVQNDVRFSCKSYEQSILKWNPPGTKCEGGIINVCWDQFERPLACGLFFEKNQQFLNNLSEYQWVKFNYIAVKVYELNYYGFVTSDRNEAGQITNISGMTALNFDNMPMYFMWDLEQDMSFDDTNHIKVDPESLSQYQFSKKLYPKNHRGVTFLWRFPRPWRQYFSTYYFRGIDKSRPWHEVMANLSGIKNFRSPSRLLGCHKNPFFTLLIPTDPAYGVKGQTQIAYNFYLGCSFKGRAIQGVVSGAPTKPEPTVDLELHV